jgi:signal transduction histidine kinase/DNA-binding response OmpR family regulator
MPTDAVRGPAGGASALAREPRGARVLVVDDTEGNRYAVSRLLRGAGMQVRESATAADALRQLAAEVPDLVVLDINLPDASGHDVLQAIKGNPATAAVPVMHVSASLTSNADRARGLEVGADAYLTHPLDPDVFVATARALLRAEGERARLYDSEHRARRAAEASAARATLLHDLTAALARTMSAAEVSQVVLTHAFTALDAATGMLVVATADGRDLQLLGAVNIPDDIAAAWRRYPVTAESPMAEAVRTARPVSLSSRAAMRRHFPSREGDVFTRLPEAPQSLYAAPMVVDRGPAARVLGAMLFLWTREEAVGPSEAALIAAVADQCALALERARLYDAERAARAAAVDASRAKTQLLSTLSHELRTPLNSVRGHLDLIDAGVYGPLTEGQREAIARASRSAVYLTGLINDLLNFARLESGTVAYDIGDVQLTGPGGVLEDIEALVAAQAAAKGVRVAPPAPDDACAPGGAPLQVRADGDKVRIILTNLVTNAIKFTDAGGTVSVSVEAGAGRGAEVVRVRVADTGRGIPADQLERIFEPFVQVDRHVTGGSQQGVGLGLSISRTLAQAMGGDLVAESSVGTGSAFTLTLPRA